MASSSRTMLGQYAGLVTRGAALVLDIIIVSLAIIIINWVISLPITYFLNVDLSSCGDEQADFQNLAFILCKSVNILWFLVTVLTPPIYFAVLMSIAGQTVGKYLMGVRVVRMDGQRMTIPLSFVRWLGYFISAILLGFGFWIVLVDRERRALHDRLVGTCVIYSWRARQNEFLVDRVYRWFHKGDSERNTRALPTLSTAYDIVAIALPNYSRLQSMLNLFQNAVDRDDTVVINTAVLAKDSYGDLGVVGVSDLAVGNNDLSMIDATLNIPVAQLTQIQNEMPSDSFIIIALLLDEYASILTGLVSKRSPAMIRVYDVGAHPETLTDSDGSPLQKAPNPVEAASK
jgi:uncharacterized RDD family membrane protein YckC